MSRFLRQSVLLRQRHVDRSVVQLETMQIGALRRAMQIGATMQIGAQRVAT